MAAISPMQYRHVLGHFITGVTVVAATGDDGALRGFTASAFTSVSLDPPLILVCPSYRSNTYPALASSGRFSVNLLAADQGRIARVFAGKTENKSGLCRWHRSESGYPVIEGTMGVIECRWHCEYEGGDHAIVLGAVEAMTMHSAAAPLVCFRGDLLGPADLARMGDAPAPRYERAS